MTLLTLSLKTSFSLPILLFLGISPFLCVWNQKRHALNILVVFFPSIWNQHQYKLCKFKIFSSVMSPYFSPSKKCLYFCFLILFYQVYTYWIKDINNISKNTNLHLSLEPGLQTLCPFKASHKLRQDL